MLRRVSSLFNAFGDGEPEIDYKGLVKEAEAVRVKDSNLKWFDWERYSNRQDTRMFMGGIIGSASHMKATLASICRFSKSRRKSTSGNRPLSGWGRSP